MVTNYVLKGTCPGCGSTVKMTPSMKITPELLSPRVVSKLIPDKSVFIYRITSEDIKIFVRDKIRGACKGAIVDLIPRYAEQRKGKDGHHAYASLRVVMSDDVVENKNDYGWLGRIGEAARRPQLVNNLYLGIIKKWLYNPNDINEWLKYKRLDELESKYGITEAFVRDIKHYRDTIVVPDNTVSGKNWVMFAAAPENIIRDMLRDEVTKEPVGDIKIVDVRKLGKTDVEFVVQLIPGNHRKNIDAHVRQILLGQDKKK